MGGPSYAAWSTPAPPRAATARRPSSSPCPCSASTKRPSPPAAGWSSRALAQGVHGVHLARARDPEGVKRFVQAARYPIHKQATDTLGVGLRGWGSHTYAAWVWGLSVPEYLQKADVWPLNPEGEIMLGVKLEDQEALDSAAETLSVPGPGLCRARTAGPGAVVRLPGRPGRPAVAAGGRRLPATWCWS